MKFCSDQFASFVWIEKTNVEAVGKLQWDLCNSLLVKHRVSSFIVAVDSSVTIKMFLGTSFRFTEKIKHLMLPL